MDVGESKGGKTWARRWKKELRGWYQSRNGEIGKVWKRGWSQKPVSESEVGFWAGGCGYGGG